MSVRNTARAGHRRQAERSARTREALLESAAKAISRNGYGSLSLEQVATGAGYTRGALYHQFRDKDDLVLAAVDWVDQTWRREVGGKVSEAEDPAAALIALARAHAVYCRRDVAWIRIALQVEFAGREHPVGRAIEESVADIVGGTAAVIAAGRRAGSIPSGPPAALAARAFVGAVEGAVIQAGGKAPHDAELAERVARGVLGLSPAA